MLAMAYHFHHRALATISGTSWTVGLLVVYSSSNISSPVWSSPSGGSNKISLSHYSENAYSTASAIGLKKLWLIW